MHYLCPREKNAIICYLDQLLHRGFNRRFVSKMNGLMSFKMATSRERFSTHTAFIRLFACMSLLVTVQWTWVRTFEGTLRARVRSFTCVWSKMGFQMCFDTEPLFTVSTFKRLFARMRSEMSLQQWAAGKLFATDSTSMRLLHFRSLWWW